MDKKFFVLLCLFIYLLFTGIVTQAQDTHPQKLVDCSLCHICSKPTTENPCFKPCPRPFKNKEVGAKLLPGESPDVIIIDKLEDLYEPVRFSHKLHADMAEMSGGCVICHHYTPQYQSHPTCQECHDPNEQKENIRQVGLKAAYHRHCLLCHCEWSKETDCEICHALKSKKQAEGTAYKSHHYKSCNEPERKLYKTDFEQGAFVTFFHNNHSNFYGLNCANCHREDACIACHYQKEKPLSVVEAHADMMHYKCSACHDINTESGCSKCHSKSERVVFDHGQATGWTLGVYHQQLSCECCHPRDKCLTKPNQACNHCHSKWNSENFDHSIAGIELDETHLMADCSDCHVNRQFENKPDCSGCHEGEKTYPKDKPGKVTTKGR